VLSRGEHAEARPLRLDSPLVFQSVAATNCLQNYNFSKTLQGIAKTFSSKMADKQTPTNENGR
jgi:hypothetical protein